MITDTIINIFLFLPRQLLELLPDVSIEFPDGLVDTFSEWLGMLSWVFPVVALMPIFVISFALSVFKIAWALLIRIKSFIPTMGA